MELYEVLRSRRSIRIYSGEPVTEEAVERILQAGLMSASAKAIRPWEFIVVRDREMLAKMAKSRAAGAAMLEKADAAIVVLGDEDKSDVWVEDCSIAMANMHLMAESLGVGSCWIQGRNRMASEEVTTEEYLRNALGFPANLRLEAVLSLGMPKRHPAPTDAGKLLYEKIHREVF